jgi:hypothetical protein
LEDIVGPFSLFDLAIWIGHGALAMEAAVFIVADINTAITVDVPSKAVDLVVAKHPFINTTAISVVLTTNPILVHAFKAVNLSMISVKGYK